MLKMHSFSYFLLRETNRLRGVHFGENHSFSKSMGFSSRNPGIFYHHFGDSQKMELWRPKQYQRFWHQKVPNRFMSGGIFENSTCLRHVLQNKPKTNLPFRIWLSISWWRLGRRFLAQKWDAIDNLRTSSSPNWWFDSSWFLPFGREKNIEEHQIYSESMWHKVWQKIEGPNVLQKLFAASTMLYFFEMATYLKGHGLTEIWRRKLPIIRLERSQKAWCKVGKKPEVGSDLYHCSECFYILFPQKKLDDILLPLDGEFQWMSNFWGDLWLKSFPGWLLRDPPHPENGQPPHCPALKHVETLKKHVSTRIPAKTEVSKCMIFFVVLILGDNFETSRNTVEIQRISCSQKNTVHATILTQKYKEYSQIPFLGRHLGVFRVGTQGHTVCT